MDTKKYRIKISQEEHLHLLNVAGSGRRVLTAFGPAGVWITEQSELWVIKEIAKSRGLIPE